MNDNPPENEFYYKKLDLSLSDLMKSNSIQMNDDLQRQSISIEKLNAFDKDVLNKYLIYTIDYYSTPNSTQLPFYVEKYTGELKYLINEDSESTDLILIEKNYQFNVIVTDTLYSMSILFDVRLINNKPIVSINENDDNLLFFYNLQLPATLQNQNYVINRINLTKFSLNTLKRSRNIQYDYNLTYEFQYGDNNQDLFQIDYNTGVIRIVGSVVNYGFYTFKVLIRNNSDSRLSNQVVYLISTIFVQIRPVFDLNSIQNVFYLTDKNVKIYNLINDTSYNLNFKLLSQQYQYLFQVNEFNGTLECKNVGYLLNNSSYVLNIAVTSDLNGYLGSIQVILNTNFTDSSNNANTNIDVFNQVLNKTYLQTDTITFDLREDLPIGSLVIDFNQYYNSNDIIYKFNLTDEETLNSSVYFYIQPLNQVILKLRLNYNYVSRLSLKLFAFKFSNNQIQLTKAITFNINLIKVNNLKPQFPYLNYKFNLKINDLVQKNNEKYLISNIKAYNKYSQSSILYYLQTYNGDDDYDSSLTDYLQISPSVVNTGSFASARNSLVDSTDNTGKRIHHLITFEIQS